MRSIILVLVACAIVAPARAQSARQEPVGCDKFKWPIEKERLTLTGTDLPSVNPGQQVALPIPFGIIVALKPFADANLLAPPERKPKSPDSFAGFFEVAAPKKAGTYKITLSAEGWIDVVQEAHAVKSTAFSGALGCEGVRKSVKFELAAKPLTIELSNVPDNTIKIAVSPE